MSAQFVQYLLTGLTVGAIYALVALGFSIIFNASHVINFAQEQSVNCYLVASFRRIANSDNAKIPRQQMKMELPAKSEKTSRNCTSSLYMFPTAASKKLSSTG